jgi:electron-transferring-flavoprotein dehydrogenase
MERVDVAVVGGGPSGSSAGHAAAEGGADTVVFESGVPRADRPEVGPDSTDAAGFLDYWVDIMGIDPAELPDGVVLREIDRAEFVGPSESITLRSTGMESSYDSFGFTFHRARFDDFLRERAEGAGADYRVGTAVSSVDSEPAGDGYQHTLTLRDGSVVVAGAVVLADGPQRRVTIDALDQFLDDPSEYLSPPTANHIAYQEYRRLPEELFDPDSIKFWWGWMPGETAYPWVFPDSGTVARVGLTMPIGLDIDDFDASEYRLLREDDDSIPDGSEYIRRLLSELYPDYGTDDFPLAENRGKQGGTETYPISSTRPVESPAGADLAVVGGAMGTTSAFHEGGDHVAVRSGAIAGRLAAEGRLEGYNDEWREAIGAELRRNIAMADIVTDYRPDDWNRAFRIAREMQSAESDGDFITLGAARSAAGGLGLYARYKLAKFRNRGGRIAAVRESEYSV